MVLVIFILIVGLILFLFFGASENNNVRKNKMYSDRFEYQKKFYPLPSKHSNAEIINYLKTCSVYDAKAYYNHVRLNNEYLSNEQYKAYAEKIAQEDDDYLISEVQYIESAAQGKRLMKKYKAQGYNFSDKAYGLWTEKIADFEAPEKIKKIEKMTPEQAFKWWNRVVFSDNWQGKKVIEALRQKIGPTQEEELLEKLDSVTKGRIDGWVNARKKESYFFSDAVLNKINKIKNGEIDNRKLK